VIVQVLCWKSRGKKAGTKGTDFNHLMPSDISKHLTPEHVACWNELVGKEVSVCSVLARAQLCFQAPSVGSPVVSSERKSSAKVGSKSVQPRLPGSPAAAPGDAKSVVVADTVARRADVLSKELSGLLRNPKNAADAHRAMRLLEDATKLELPVSTHDLTQFLKESIRLPVVRKLRLDNQIVRHVPVVQSSAAWCQERLSYVLRCTDKSADGIRAVLLACCRTSPVCLRLEQALKCLDGLWAAEAKSKGADGTTQHAKRLVEVLSLLCGSNGFLVQPPVFDFIHERVLAICDRTSIETRSMVSKIEELWLRLHPAKELPAALPNAERFLRKSFSGRILFASFSELLIPLISLLQERQRRSWTSSTNSANYKRL
jgi:hypothetical protein